MYVVESVYKLNYYNFKLNICMFEIYLSDEYVIYCIILKLVVWGKLSW